MPRVSQVGRERLEAELIQCAGNLTRAADALGISRMHAMRLATQYGLRERAKELRLEAGGAVTGRPRGQCHKQGDSP